MRDEAEEPRLVAVKQAPEVLPERHEDDLAVVADRHLDPVLVVERVVELVAVLEPLVAETVVALVPLVPLVALVPLTSRITLVALIPLVALVPVVALTTLVPLVPLAPLVRLRRDEVVEAVAESVQRVRRIAEGPADAERDRQQSRDGGDGDNPRRGAPLRPSGPACCSWGASLRTSSSGACGRSSRSRRSRSRSLLSQNLISHLLPPRRPEPLHTIGLGHGFDEMSAISGLCGVEQARPRERGTLLGTANESRDVEPGLPVARIVARCLAERREPRLPGPAQRLRLAEDLQRLGRPGRPPVRPRRFRRRLGAGRR